MITGKLRITARTQADAEEIAGYLWRMTGANARFRRPTLDRDAGAWTADGDIEVPDEEDTRTNPPTD